MGAHYISKSTGICIAIHSLTFRSRSALPMTDTELKLMAAPAMMGLRSKPKNGYSKPAAMGIPSAL